MPSRSDFQTFYAGKRPPWDIDGPQKAFTAVADRITGSVLDAGCGTGENALFFASRGQKVTGIDFIEEPLQRARAKAQERGLPVKFLLKDALTLKDWTERFDNVIDSGLFHVFSDKDRQRYVAGLATVLKPGGRFFLMCFSDEETGDRGATPGVEAGTPRCLRRGLDQRVYRADIGGGPARLQGVHFQRGWAEGVVCSRAPNGVRLRWRRRRSKRESRFARKPL